MNKILVIKGVKCIETNIVYTSAQEASRQTGINASSIGSCRSRNRKTAGGLHWVNVFGKPSVDLTNFLYVNIKGYNDYLINTRGEIYSKKTDKILKTEINNSGYAQVMLYNNLIKKRTNFLVHFLVAKTFLHNPKNLPCINHKDENKINNNVENLEWCTYSYNNCYGSSIEKRAKSHKIPVLRKSTGVIYLSVKEASLDTGISISAIRECCNPNSSRKMAGGEEWEYRRSV